MRNKIITLGALALFAAAAEAAGGKAALVPEPRSVVLTGGSYSAPAVPGTILARDAELPCAAIRFETDAALPAEGYRLEITPSGVTVWSADAAGAFYATRTLKQLSCVSGDRKKGFALEYPCCTVTDAPAFRWRGFLLDEGRHFFGKEVVCRYLDLMADHKLNVFHWHLTEDQGWRLALDRFPELAQYGAVRPESVRFGYTGRPQTGDQVTNGEKYGPYFYTADDVREILAYAAARHVTVIPEIEVPGHVRALLAAHPEFSCKGDIPRVPRVGNSIEDDVLCAGNDEAILFIEQVYDEVMKLFPGAYFHLGGDECPKKRWKECPKCQARMKALGLKDEEELQGWFTRHFTEYLAKKGRRAIGWDEVLAGKPSHETIVQSWRANAKYAVAAAEAGHDVIVSSVDATYFSVPERHPDDPFTYMSPNRHVTLTEAYQFDPYKGMTEVTKPRVIGAECALWSECIWNVFDLDYKAWPRTCAFAEAVWSAPADRDAAAFAARMEQHRRRLIAQGVNCAPVEKSGFVAAPTGKDLGPVLTDAEVRTCKRLSGKKAAAFVDDVLWALRDLTRTSPKSVWEVPFFKMLKECHDRYGLKIQLNLFYRADFFYGADEFSLADVPDRFKDEFQGAKGWLKFGFHSQHEFPDYPWVNIDYADMKFFFERIQNEVRRFAGEGMFAKAVVPHWLPVSKDGCRAMKDCGATVICCTDGPRIAYEGDPSVLPYGHAARVEHNRKPETALYRRVCNDVAIAASVAAYNHTSTAQTEETCGYLKYVYDKATGLAFKRFRSAPMLNLDRLEDLEREFSKSLKYDFMCFANHEQYFYSDYLAHQPDYGAKMLFASKFAHDHGYEFVFIEDTVD